MWYMWVETNVWKSLKIWDDCIASSLDQAGLFTTDALGAAILLREISGHDEKDSTSSMLKSQIILNTV